MSSELAGLVRFIDEERQRQNLSMRELAERGGMTAPTVSRILSGQTSPSLASLEALAQGLGYSFIAFLLKAGHSVSGFEEMELGSVYKKLSAHDRQSVLLLARALLKNEEEDPGRS
jgi:transcriptional regulator with XRE-family HTH domain